jgi:hypothetical protein
MERYIYNAKPEATSADKPDAYEAVTCLSCRRKRNTKKRRKPSATIMND